MTSYIAAIAQGRPRDRQRPVQDDLRRRVLLFLITLVLNAISIRFVRKYRQVYE